VSVVVTLWVESFSRAGTPPAVGPALPDVAQDERLVVEAVQEPVRLPPARSARSSCPGWRGWRGARAADQVTRWLAADTDLWTDTTRIVVGGLTWRYPLCHLSG
jgi:hypothetical protein